MGLKREHLKDLEGFAPLPLATRQIDTPLQVGQDVRHARADNPKFLSALREGPGRKSRQVQGVKAEAGEHVTILGLEEIVDGTMKSSWAKVSSASGVGWLN